MQDRIQTSASNKELFRMLAIPSIIRAVFTGLLQIGDKIIAAFFIGSSTLVTLNLISPFFMMVFSLIALVIAGFSIELNYLMGKKEREKAQGLSTFILLFVSILLIVVSLVMILFTDGIINFLQIPTMYHEYAGTYLRVYAVAFLPFGIGFICNIMILADGKGYYSMISQLVNAVVNIVFNCIFVIGFNMGILGLGIGTLIANTVFMIMTTSYFIFKKYQTVKFGKMFVSFKELRAICYNGASDFFATGSFSICMYFVNLIIVKNFDSTFLEAYAAAHLFTTLFFDFYSGGIEGVSPVISKAYGEDNIDRGVSITRYTYFKTITYSFLIYLLSSLAVTPLASIFVKDSVALNKVLPLYFLIGLNGIIASVPIYAGAFLSSIKKPFLSLLIDTPKVVFVIPLFVYIGAILIGEFGITIGWIFAELSLFPFIFFVLKRTVRKERIKFNSISKEEVLV